MCKQCRTLRRDFGVFAQPGFVLSLAILLVLFAIMTGALISGTSKHAVPLWPFS